MTDLYSPPSTILPHPSPFEGDPDTSHRTTHQGISHSAIADLSAGGQIVAPLEVTEESGLSISLSPDEAVNPAKEVSK